MKDRFAKYTHKQIVIATAVISGIVRTILAAVLAISDPEAVTFTIFGNNGLIDFGTPPLAGLISHTLTGSSSIYSELFFRTGSIIAGTLSTYLIYLIGRSFRNERTGLYAALLFTASPYCMIFGGTLFTPESPKVLFTLLSIYIMHDCFFIKQSDTNREYRYLSNHAMMLSGLCIGIAILADYTAVYLWLGMILFMATGKHLKTFLNPFLYISVLITATIALPAIISGLKADTASSIAGNIISGNFSLGNIYRGIVTDLLAHNPLNLALYAITLPLAARNGCLGPEKTRFLIMQSFPALVLSVPAYGFFGTEFLSATAFLPLMVIAAAYIDDSRKEIPEDTRRVPKKIKTSIYASTALVAAWIVFTNAMFLFGNGNAASLSKYGRIAGISGWGELSESFEKLRIDDIHNDMMPENSFVLSCVKEEAAQLNVHICRPDGIEMKYLMVPVPKGNTVRYARYNIFKEGEYAYMITTSSSDRRSRETAARYFRSCEKASETVITRFGKKVETYCIYRLKHMTSHPYTYEDIYGSTDI